MLPLELQGGQVTAYLADQRPASQSSCSTAVSPYMVLPVQPAALQLPFWRARPTNTGRPARLGRQSSITTGWSISTAPVSHLLLCLMLFGCFLAGLNEL